MTELKKQYEAEFQNSKKSWGGNITIEHQITADGCYAEIKEYFDDHTDVTDWTIGYLAN